MTDTRDLRRAFGTFMTGVTVVTTRAADGTLRGFTANSFSSVSLDPPLLLVCLSKAAASSGAFSKAASFAVNILSDEQRAMSMNFASRRLDKFAGIDYRFSDGGNPLLPGAVAWFDCSTHEAVDAGDHLILIGRVNSYEYTDASPLGYLRGSYISLGSEQSAVAAAPLSRLAEVPEGARISLAALISM